MDQPTHEQAKLQLELYELRREARLRQARDWFFKNYFADSFEEAMRLGAPGTEAGTNVMMVNYGLLHEDLFFETNGEFYGVWHRVKPMASGFREHFRNMQFLAHLQKAAERFEAWMEKRSPGHIERMEDFMKQMRAQAQKAA